MDYFSFLEGIVPKTNSHFAPENWYLEDEDFLFKMVAFSADIGVDLVGGKIKNLGKL